MTDIPTGFHDLLTETTASTRLATIMPRRLAPGQVQTMGQCTGSHGSGQRTDRSDRAAQAPRQTPG